MKSSELALTQRIFSATRRSNIFAGFFEVMQFKSNMLQYGFHLKPETVVAANDVSCNWSPLKKGHSTTECFQIRQKCLKWFS